MKKVLLSKTTWCLLIGVALIVGMSIPGKLSITITKSLDKRVFWMSDDTSLIKKGDYVLFGLDTGRLSKDVTIPETVIKGTLVRAIKRVACFEGEILRVDGLDYYCNEVSIGRAKTLTIKGKPLAQFVFNGPIPKESVFVIGDHPDSYDSRYYGLIDRSTFISRAIALF